MSRDSGLYEAALDVLRKSSSAEARRTALAYLGERGVDEGAALVEAARCSGAPGPLRKDAGPAGAVQVRAAMDGGGTLSLDLSRAEGVDLFVALQDAMTGRGSR